MSKALDRLCIVADNKTMEYPEYTAAQSRRIRDLLADGYELVSAGVMPHMCELRKGDHTVSINGSAYPTQK